MLISEPGGFTQKTARNRNKLRRKVSVGAASPAQ